MKKKLDIQSGSVDSSKVIEFFVNCLSAIEETNAKLAENVYENDVLALVLLAHQFIDRNFDNGLVEYDEFEKVAMQDAYLMPTIVKVFLTRLESPLLTKAVLVTCLSTPEIRVISNALSTLPEPNRTLLELLLRHLKRLLKFKNVNRMRSVNYSICLNSCLFSQTGQTDRQFHTKILRLFNLLIKSAREIFNASSEETSSTSSSSSTSSKNKSVLKQLEIKSTHQVLTYEKFKEVGVGARSLLELLKSSNDEKNAGSSGHISEFQLYSNKSHHYTATLRIKKKKSRNFTIKNLFRRDRVELNVDDYLKIVPKFHQFSSNNDDRFVRLLKLIDRNLIFSDNNSQNQVPPEIDISSILRDVRV